MGYISKLKLLVNTVKYLKPGQIINQVLVRIKPKENFLKYLKEDVKFHKANLWLDELDGENEYVERFLPEELLDNRITLLNETHSFDRWHYDDASHLWNFNVHYLEYLVALKAKYKETNDEQYIRRLNDILDDWYKNGAKDQDSNQAYTISLRIINQLIISDVVDDQQTLYRYIYAQYKYLLKHQEKHLLGNHYFENLKAIVICSLVFGEEKIYKKYISKLIKEADEEILPDGLHFERSLMYHKIIMEDEIRVAVVLRQFGREEYKSIIGYIKGMCTALYSLEGGLERTPLFNDAGEGVSKSAGFLLNAVKNRFDIVPEIRTCIDGYYRIDENGITVLMDCGELAPKYMPGHAHNDCLSYELFLNGKPVLVNSGTYQYQGEHRSFFRSTKAHNTVTINDNEQSELWGEHRAGRKVSGVKVKAQDKTIIAECRNYLKEKHIRELTMQGGTLTVIDETEGKGKSFLHIAGDYEYKNGTISDESLTAEIEAINAEFSVESSLYAPSFGKMEKCTLLTFSWNDDNNKHGYKIKIERSR